jgi:hypothetical protein
MVVVGLVAYIKTPHGLKSLKTVWAQHLSDEEVLQELVQVKEEGRFEEISKEVLACVKKVHLQRSSLDWLAAVNVTKVKRIVQEGGTTC